MITLGVERELAVLRASKLRSALSEPRNAQPSEKPIARAIPAPTAIRRTERRNWSPLAGNNPATQSTP